MDRPASKLLGNLLSTESRISTTSANTAQRGPWQKPKELRNIGWGTCGIIHAADGHARAFKIAHNDDGQLWNDYIMHTCVWEAIHKNPGLQIDVHVPKPHFFVPCSDEEQFWRRHDDMFPVYGGRSISDSEGKPVLASERIFPLPEGLRVMLIRHFCPVSHHKEAYRSRGNQDCLVRVYLGSRRGKSDSLFFSLRNFELHLNQMEQLAMDTKYFGEQLASALAKMHWIAEVDARDVEFVIGSAQAPASPEVDGGAPPNEYIPLSAWELEHMEPNTFTEPLVHSKSPLRLWLLDFNQCRTMSMDEEGVEKAVHAFRVNDPYYPRPPVDGDDNGEDAQLWQHFCATYLTVSDRILRNTQHGRFLAATFIEKVERVYRQKPLWIDTEGEDPVGVFRAEYCARELW